MEQFVNPARCCSECSSREYVFYGRKKVTAEPGKPATVEPNYVCTACGHAWGERVAVKARERLAQAQGAL